MNRRGVGTVLLFLLCFSIGLMPIEVVKAQNQSLGVAISQITPSSNGAVGSPITVQGTISSINGNYQVLFDQAVVATGTAVGYAVTTNFNVPENIADNYPLTLRDVSTSANATKQFQVTTAYSITPSYNQMQERDSVALNITVTGGQPNTPYNAKVSIVLPSPLNTTYFKQISLGSSNQRGTANALVVYPDASFQPSGSTTDFAGIYTAYFNQSENLAHTSFSVGFLDAVSYHRGQTATLKAVGYQPNQSGSLIVTSVTTGAVLSQQTLTASTDGIISASWSLPANAAIGTYIVQINPTGIAKAIVDSESISITGYPVQIKTVNLAGEMAPIIRLQVIDPASNVFTNGSSGNDGVATFNLEAGVQCITAFWNGVNVGQTNITVTGPGEFTVVCTLTSLQFVVHNEKGNPIPFAHLTIDFLYQAASGVTQTGSFSGETDVLGSYQINSTLTGITYNVTASLYNQVFSVSTMSDVKVEPLSKLLIVCPNEVLTLSIIGNSQAKIAAARIELVEVSNSLFYTATTDDNGSVSSQVTFGTYRVRIYKDNILINETNIAVFAATQQQILCSQYGIAISVSVVDVLGQPIQNANVTLIGQVTGRFTALTKSNGVAIFDEVIGGNMQVIAFAQGAPSDYQAVTQTVNQPTLIEIKLDKYVALGPFLLETNTLLTIAIILSLILVFSAFEIYQRKKR